MTPISCPHLLRPDQFPVVLRAFREDTRALVWEVRVERPEHLAALYVPPLSARHGVRVLMRIEFGDGTVVGDLDAP